MSESDSARLAAGVEHLAESTDGLIDEVRGLARAEARQEVRKSAKRQRAAATSQILAAAGWSLCAVLVSIVLVDVHTHRGHIEPLERRVIAIEQLIAEVGAGLADGQLPDLEGERFSTAGALPLMPAAEQDGAPVGIWIIPLLALMVAGCIWAWLRIHGRDRGD